VVGRHPVFQAGQTVFIGLVDKVTRVNDDMRLISLNNPCDYRGITVITHALPDIAINVIG
jgi:hypothetical protein